MRDIDDIIRAVREHPSIPPVHKQVIIARIEKEPAKEEIEEASSVVYPEET